MEEREREKNVSFLSYDSGKWLPVYLYRKKSNARRFFNYPHRRNGKKGCHVQKMFWRETPPVLCCCFCFFGGQGCRIGHTLTHKVYTIFHSELKHIHNLVGRNKIGNENKLFAVRSAPSFSIPPPFHSIVFFHPNACTNMFILCHIVVSDWKSDGEK